MKPSGRVLSRSFLTPLTLLLAVVQADYLHALGDELEGELPAVVSASRLTQSVLNSPSAVTIIDRAMIEASGFTEIADLFRLVPGFQVAHADGRVMAVVYHGDGWEYPNRLQVLINGRSTYLPVLSVVDWNTTGVHIKDIERIEVVRGPSASAYGSNSFSAAINIITKAPILDQSYQFYSRIGSKRDRDLLLRFSGGETEAFRYRVSASYRENDGLDYYDDSRVISTLAFNGQGELSPRDSWDLQLELAQGKTGSGEQRFLLPTQRKVKMRAGQLKWQHLISDNQELAVSLNHIRYCENDLTRTPLLSDIMGITPEQFTDLTGADDQFVVTGVQTHAADKTNLEVNFSQYNHAGFQYVVGAGVSYETLKSLAYIPYGGQLSDTSYRLLGNLQFPLAPRLMGNIGAIYENNRDTDEPYFSPRASLNWHFYNQQSLRFSLSRAYRIPSLLERNFDTRTVLDNGFELDQRYRSSPNLKAERLDSLELGWAGQHLRLPLQWEIKAYREEMKNLVGYVLDTSSNDFIGDHSRVVMNIGSRDVSGVEGELFYRPAQNTFLRFHFNRSWHDKDPKLVEIGQKTRYKFADVVPRQSYGLLGSYRFDDWQLSAGVYYMGSMEWAGHGDQVDSYTRVDLGIARHFRLAGGQQLTLKASAQNIANHYYEFSRWREMEPRYFLSMELSKF